MSTSEIKRVALVGGGVIGGGWATRCLAHGLEVVVTDPKHEARDYVEKTVADAWPVLEEAGLTDQGNRDRLYFADDIAAAVTAADFIQENVPEREDLKIAVHEEISQHAAPASVIASSSSGLLPSRLQSRCKHPERLIIGHPFAPVYLLPLVEVVGGEQTSLQAISRAGDFYRSIGMRPLHVRREIEAYIADRLQESLYREALHLINDGVATVAEIDAAVTGGPGLRWAFMGTFLAWHLGGGPGGMRHTIEQFGPALELPWSHMQAPKLTDELKRRIVEGCEEESGVRDFNELERRRDRCLVEIQKVLEQHWYPQGEDGWPEMQ
ncbi:MAG: 3-hydroxyacyl-CoA dehydrogenase NAD-binding domain-containing protein [Arenicellales bacterium]|jgi:carnitine 3-dehydrogenase|nr:3-hydroxyacyl-CoA dehydrogenase NAD-binding domain-containing protein [Arenicellales bacterium]MDP6313837.1 3-hydroxyacyl-CoA dehydrogenase NAD-binding domain-containing protein [Arenicellales bacterium]